MMDRHAYWTEYLKKAKNGHDRPLHGSTTKRVIRGAGGSVILRLHATDVVTHHADGTETIRTDGWNTVTTARFLSEHSKASVYSDKGQWYVRVRKPEITPPRVRKCRRCTDGYQPRTCWGPGYCWARQWMTCDQDHDEATGRHLTCEHGQTAGHALPPAECWQCKGVGRYDYGSKEVHHAWNGGPLTIDADGYAVPGSDVYTPAPQNFTPPAPKQVGYVPGVGTVAASSSSYSDSGRLLGAALPGLRTEVTCPHCDSSPMELLGLIIHLNDSARWTREQVADWLDTLDVDLTFPTPDTIPAHIH
jgi:hypothetical protein